MITSIIDNKYYSIDTIACKYYSIDNNTLLSMLVSTD